MVSMVALHAYRPWRGRYERALLQRYHAELVGLAGLYTRPLAMQDAIEALDPRVLTPIVAHSLGQNAASVTVSSWTTAPLLGGVTGAHIFRIAGEASVADSTQSWSLVVKRCAPPSDPSRAANNDWQRAVLAHEYDLLPLDAPTAGLVAARCHGVTRPPDGSVWLWTEDLSALPTSPWTPADYLRAARHFGRFNAAPLAQGAVPSHPWFFQSFLRYWLDDRMRRHTLATMTAETWRLPLAPLTLQEELLTGLIQQPETWDHPLLRAAFPQPVAGRALRLWRDRHLLLDALDRLPRSLIHGDAHPGNLYRRLRPDGDVDTVAIDWDTVGLGPFGEDPGRLLGIAALFSGPDRQAATDLYDGIVGAYLAGIDDTFQPAAPGSPPSPARDPLPIRFAIAATAALFGALNASTVCAAALSPELQHTPYRTALERDIGTSTERFLPTAARAAYFLLDLADEAFTLLPHLPDAPK